MAVKLLAGRYELIEKIGDGGMAVVYKARDRLLNRFIAIKILKPEFAKDQNVIDSFRRESQSAAALSHPNIVSIYDVGREGNIHFIVMELIEGETLSNIIDEEGPLEYHTVINITKQIASGLGYAHQHGIIHRDIKPHNILMTRDGVAKIADFGIAKAITESAMAKQQTEEMVMGSVHYFSPEQARGGYVDAKSDIYSLGIVMYEMLTGRVPFDAETPVQVALMHINDEMTPPSYYVDTIPPRLEGIIMKATNKVQVNRYRDCEEMIRELDKIEIVTKIVGEKAVAPEGVRIREPEEEEPEKKPKQKKKKKKDDDDSGKKKKIIIIAAAAVVVIAAILGVLLHGGKDIEVPDLTGKTVEEAEEILDEAGLKLAEGNEVYSDEYEEGLIVSQSPKAGMEVKKGKTIKVNISKGTGTVEVPSVIGYTTSEAKETLEAQGFRLGSVKEEESSQTPGTIISQDPNPGTQAESGATVNVVIAKEVEVKTVAVPGLLGKSIDSAEKALNKVGLNLGNINYEYNDDYPEGQIIAQQYSSGTEVNEGTSVDITVSRGSKAEPEPEPEPEPDDGGDEGDTETEDDGD